MFSIWLTRLQLFFGCHFRAHCGIKLKHSLWHNNSLAENGGFPLSLSGSMFSPWVSHMGPRAPFSPDSCSWGGSAHSQAPRRLPSPPPLPSITEEANEGFFISAEVPGPASIAYLLHTAWALRSLPQNYTGAHCGLLKWQNQVSSRFLPALHCLITEI